MHGKSRGKKFIFILLFAPLFIAGYTFIVMSLWNWLMPDIIGASELTFWQALGLIALVKLLFGFGGRGWKNRGYNKKSHWKERMKEKFRNMSDEDKDNLKENLATGQTGDQE